MSRCPACEATITPGARACSECGASLVPAPVSAPGAVQAIVPWAAFGLAALAMVVALVALFDGAGGTAAPMASAPVAVSAPGQPVDLASLSPREAADRLFNRVMAASERGDMTEALRFAPMALQAYDQLDRLDNDARYHIALLRLTTEDIAGARVQIEMLRQAVPQHLLVYTLELQIAARDGRQDNAKTYRAFLAAYDAEMAAGRTEYEDHRGTLERFRREAQTALTGKK